MNSVLENIIKNKQLEFNNRIKALIYYLARRRGGEKSWDKRHEKVFQLNNNYNEPCSDEVEAEHKNKWSAFRSNVDVSTLRICKNISGRADANIVPEDIFVSDIEPTLIIDDVTHFLSHKSFYNRWFPDGLFPSDICHCIDGQYLDSVMKTINMETLEESLLHISYPVIFKPNWHSYGGQGVHLIENADTLISACEKNSNFVVQEQIVQHDFFNKYNPVGLNTIRVYVYQSVADNRCHVINMALRMGKGGSLDNLSAGGIQTMIRSDGVLNNYAVDKYGKKYTCHPDTGYNFDEQIPAIEDLKRTAIKVAEQVYFTRIVGLDLCYDEAGKWRVIEINTKGHTIRFAQYGGQPFFGEFTDEVIEYCKKNHWTLNK